MNIEPILHKKTFQELTTDELYELLRIRSEVFSNTFMLDGIPHIKMTWSKQGYLTNFVFCVIGAVTVLWIWKKLFD